MSLNNVFIGNTWDVPTRATGRVYHPYGPNNTSHFFTQEFVQRGSSFKRLPLNTVYNVDGEVLADYYLIDESATTDLGGGILKWTRTYSPIHPDHVEYEQFAYQFPVTSFTDSELFALRGFKSNDTWDSEVRCKHFLVGVSRMDVTPKTLITTPSQIPVLCPMIIVNGVTNSITNIFDASTTYRKIANPQLCPDCVADTTGHNTKWTSGDGYSVCQADYKLKISNGEFIVAQSSVKQRIMGNLYVRKTRYVQAR